MPSGECGWEGERAGGELLGFGALSGRGPVSFEHYVCVECRYVHAELSDSKVTYSTNCFKEDNKSRNVLLRRKDEEVPSEFEASR